MDANLPFEINGWGSQTRGVCASDLAATTTQLTNTLHSPAVGFESRMAIVDVPDYDRVLALKQS